MFHNEKDNCDFFIDVFLCLRIYQNLIIYSVTNTVVCTLFVGIQMK